MNKPPHRHLTLRFRFGFRRIIRTERVQRHTKRRATLSHPTQCFVGQTLVECPRFITAIVTNVEFTFGAIVPSLHRRSGQRFNRGQHRRDMQFGFVVVTYIQDFKRAIPKAIITVSDMKRKDAERLKRRGEIVKRNRRDKIEVRVAITDYRFIGQRLRPPNGVSKTTCRNEWSARSSSSYQNLNLFELPSQLCHDETQPPAIQTHRSWDKLDLEPGAEECDNEAGAK